MRYDVRIETFEEGEPLPSEDVGGFKLLAFSETREGFVYHLALFSAPQVEKSDD